MKTLTIIAATMTAVTAHAASSGVPETAGMSLLVMLFLAFGALIVVCQLIPGAVLFFSMIKGLFTAGVKRSIADPVGTKKSV